MRDYVQDQKNLQQDGQLQDHLKHIFKQLPELHSITFADSFSNIPAEVWLIGVWLRQALHPLECRLMQDQW